jgi:hypothetical protein
LPEKSKVVNVVSLPSWTVYAVALIALSEPTKISTGRKLSIPCVAPMLWPQNGAMFKTVNEPEDDIPRERQEF